MKTNRRAVLVVDDDVAVGSVMRALLEQAGIEAVHVTSGRVAVERLEARAFDVVLTDLRMAGIDGMQLLAVIVERWADVPVVMISAHGTVPLAVEAMRAGAIDFVLKPFEREDLLAVVERALARADASVTALVTPPSGSSILGASPEVAEALALIGRAAASTATVLVRGETGTGKELAAREVHAKSARASGPFVKVNVAALPDALLESELFGYEKGAFTGANGRKPGRVELAKGGTLFLDEIGDVTPAMQVKLLRVLQEREYERLGGTETLRADVRFVAATHKNLEAMVSRGEFREDLFYRLNVIPIWMPSLRARPADIAPLAHHFCATLIEEHGRPGFTLAADALRLLEGEAWPGNVRQLHNIIERLVLLSDGPTLTASDVRRELSRSAVTAVPSSVPARSETSGALDERRREAERDAVTDALRRARGNRTLAARLLGVSRRTLYTKLETLGLMGS